ncbi:ABC transporter substrate-binding protein [Acidisphaera sp. S103]|uniref:ABC transporter substrate-binding protein n=1 Tax=Acidisphaera sp. S103 TaxID=1747223 RepID=UPI00131C1E60|nr:ABC transporter substrate-binding protein [Acidisphaera sp. S103]
MIRRRVLLSAAAVLPLRVARAEASSTIRIGVLTDLNGPNSASSGPGSVVATQLAAEDFMATHPGTKIEVLSADYQSKPDIAVSVARDWFDRQGVDIVSNINNSAAALAIANLVKEKDKVALFTSPASSALTGTACGPNHVHWTHDTWAVGKSTGGALVQQGGDSWYFVAADYAFGHQLAADTAGFVTGAGGKVLGTAFTPFPETTDFSSFLVQASSSGAKVIGLANSGIDTANCVKQAHEFGLTAKGTKLAALLMMLPDLHGVGLETAQGLVLSEAFYWDLNDGTRAYGKRYGARMNGWMPSMVQAGDYAANAHCLKAMAALGIGKTRSGRAIVEQMKAMPTDDPLFGKGIVRADGRVLHPMYLFEVKSPSESHYAWDYYKLLRTTDGADAFRPLVDGHCPMVHA